MKKKGKFRYLYLLYLLTLVILSAAAVLYVTSLLKSYEAAQPEKKVNEAIEQLIRDCESGVLWSEIMYDSLPISRYEAERSLKSDYAAMLSSRDLSVSKKAGSTDTDEEIYTVKKDGFLLTEIKLRAVGEPINRLAVFSWRNWEIADIKALFESHKYTFSIPVNYTASVGGIKLDADGAEKIGENELRYTLDGIYLPPELVISSDEGETVSYTVKGEKILPEIFNYSLTLPDTLSVKLNGELHEGEALGDGTVKHLIVTLEKPSVTIADLYGNTIEYSGESTIPLTALTVRAPETFRVTAEGKGIPDGAVTQRDNEEYSGFAEFAEGLPRLAEYRIAVLSDNASVIALTPDGREIKAESGEKLLDLTDIKGSDSIPEEISAEIDVLEIAKKWSLFVSKDLEGASNGFGNISKHLIKGSYQYSIATKYANGIDITFTSIHTLMDPPFRNEKVGNFRQITDDCFSVDISFDKHMRLYYGKEVIDSMNERWYFLKYSDDSGTAPTWRLAAMKEVGSNAE